MRLRYHFRGFFALCDAEIVRAGKKYGAKNFYKIEKKSGVFDTM